jgi:hypothetical protein
MNSKYPRPYNDSGIGFHYFPDSDHYRREDADRWSPRLTELGASWLVMQTAPNRPVPDVFLQRIMLADIEPVVMIKPSRITPLDLTALAGTVRSLADSGVHYVVLFDRPNARDSWSAEEWNKPELVERFVDYLMPALETVAGENLIPVLPPLDCFGAYWDTSFFQAMVQSLKRRGGEPLISGAAVGINNFANDRPLDWGAGGPKAWPGARPYTEPVEGQDHRGFRLFEWYRPLLDQVLGQELPFVVCANGPQRPIGGESIGDEVLYAERALAMARMMTDGALPATVLNHAYWVLAAERGDPAYRQAWFRADGVPRLPAAQAFLKLGKTRRANLPVIEPVTESWTAATTVKVASRAATTMADSAKPIEHYLLLPVFEWGLARWHLSIVQEYVEAFMPTVGFSLEEAKLARHVTVIGNSQGVSVEAVRQLEAAGCHVERIAGRTGTETQLFLKQLAQNKQHSR